MESLRGTLTPHQVVMSTELQPMDLSEKSTSTTTSLVSCCPSSVAVSVLDRDHSDGDGNRPQLVEDQLHSPARSLSSSSSAASHDETSLVGGGVADPSDAARSQNQV